MSDINLTIKHGRTLEEARAALAEAVGQAQARFGPALQRVDWSADRSSVHLAGPGFEVDTWVDAQEVHLSGKIPLLGLLGALIVSSLKGIVERSFHKRLT
jgi:hypothetical protein